MKKCLINAALAVLFTHSVLAEKALEIAEPQGISHANYVTGGVIGTITGFGVGQAIHGRYWKTGWIFTLGEGAGLGLFFVGTAIAVVHANPLLWILVPEQVNQNLTAAAAFLWAGTIVYAGFRLGDVIDLWASPTLVSSDQILNPEANQKVSYLTPSEQNTPIMGFKFSF